MNPRLTLARRRALHPAYVRAVESKLDAPAEIYAYPTFVRGIGPRQRPLVVPTPIPTPAPMSSIGWFRAAYAIALLVLWTVLANVAPGV